jgi:hypothetical protein
VVGLVLDYSNATRTSVILAMRRLKYARSDADAVDSNGDIPFPFDHFFFCFLPPEVAAGAYDKKSAI